MSHEDAEFNLQQVSYKKRITQTEKFMGAAIK